MRRRDGNEHTDLANLQPSKPVHNRHVTHLELPESLPGQFFILFSAISS